MNRTIYSVDIVPILRNLPPIKPSDNVCIAVATACIGLGISFLVTALDSWNTAIFAALGMALFFVGGLLIWKVCKSINVRTHQSLIALACFLTADTNIFPYNETEVKATTEKPAEPQH